MSTHSNFMPTHHHVIHRRVETVRELSAADVQHRLTGMLTTMGVIGVVAGAWGGIGPFVAPGFNLSVDGSGTWYWDLARGMLAALPGAATLVAGVLVIGCARSIALGIGRSGLAIAAIVMLAAGGWFAIGPYAWPVLWGHSYLIHSGSMMNLARWSAFAGGPGVVLALLAGLAMGSMLLRDHARLVTEQGEYVRPVEDSGTQHSALADAEEDPSLAM